MNNTKELLSSLETLRPSLERHYIEYYTDLVNRLLGENKRFDIRETVYYDVNLLHSMTKAIDPEQSHKYGTPKEVNVERIERGASSYATNVITTFIEKIDSKLGALESSKLISGNEFFEFFVEGVKDGKNVSIKQSMRQNWSSQGRPFDQFPALCYIDGKRIKASEFKKLFA
jgi:hypothetical protein